MLQSRRDFVSGIGARSGPNSALVMDRAVFTCHTSSPCYMFLHRVEANIEYIEEVQGQ